MKHKILIQLDSDPQPSVFDRVVAVDAGAEELFSYGNVRPEELRDLVHGAIFTRSPKDLASTAIFIGGNDVAVGERLLTEAREYMLPQFKLQVSLMLDSNGANTTAAAAVYSAAKHMKFDGVRALVLGGTGPCGQRIAFLLAKYGANVGITSRQKERAERACERVRTRLSNNSANGSLEAFGTDTPGALTKIVEGQNLIFATGAAGIQLLSKSLRATCKSLKVAIDLNAVPPLGIEGVEVMDKAVERDGVICYGAIGVGDTKMKVHRAAIGKLFERNDLVLDIEEIYQIAWGLS